MFKILGQFFIFAVDIASLLAPGKQSLISVQYEFVCNIITCTPDSR